MQKSLKIGVFSYFIAFSFLFNSIAIAISMFDGAVYFYLAFVFAVTLWLMATLNKNPNFHVDISDILRIPEKWININFAIYVAVILWYLINNLGSISFESFSPEVAYERRLAAISIDKFWIIESIVKMGFALSLVYLINKKYTKWLIVTALYVLFYVASVQKAPIATYFIVCFAVYVKFNKIDMKSLFALSGFLVFVLFYFTVVTLGDSDFNRIDILVSSLFDRVMVAGELVVFLYRNFSENDLFLYGATFPKLFGLLDINPTGRYVGLPQLIMLMNSGEIGGANTTFFTEGFANFGVGFDLIFVLFLLVLVGLILYFLRTLSKELASYFLLVNAVFLIDLVHSDLWGYFHSIVLIFVYHIVGYLILFKNRLTISV